MGTRLALWQPPRVSVLQGTLRSPGSVASRPMETVAELSVVNKAPDSPEGISGAAAGHALGTRTSTLRLPGTPAQRRPAASGRARTQAPAGPCHAGVTATFAVTRHVSEFTA